MCIDYLKMNLECTILMQISQNFEKRIISLVTHFLFFSYKVSVLKTCIDYLKMHSECTILMQISHNFPGEAPRTPTWGRGWPSPPPSSFRRHAPQWSLWLHWSLVPPPPPPPPPGSGGSGSAPVLRVQLSLYLRLLKWLWYVYLL